ncbi:MAG TPA: FAD-dependent oxidoreductase [Terriglobales bacterium]|nr:FAD-dependent oxidoreductase [Terriglobales bacterium]
MPVYQCKLKSREEVAEGTMAFHFERPASFNFQAGQTVDMTLLSPPETDDEGNTRTFSIASPPFEQELMFATRMRDSAFKRSLKTLPLGTELKIDGPMGSFTLHKNAKKPAAFLAGGIGITPFLSTVAQAAHDRLPHQLYLFYSNHRPEDAPFLDFLRRLEAENPNYHFIPTMTDMERSKRPWKGETGFIDSKMVIKYLSNLNGPIYYLAGPPAMVAAMRKMLTEAKVDEDDIRTEEFAGY